MSRTSLRVALLAAGVSALAIVPSASAAAAPINAANQLVGSADCGDDGTFTFVVTENNGQGGAWNPAFITRSDGATGLFIPASFDLTFTSPDGTFVDQRTKGATSGPASCDITATPGPGLSLIGTVTGTIVWTS
jgi:hypothetical protein